MPQESRYSLQMENPPLVDYGNGAPPPRAAYRNSDIDFRDVFGGPPRRTSAHDVRYSFTEGMDSVDVSGRRIGETSARDPWTATEEKPVFGEAESVNRRRYLREDFFDDIFKGGESPSSTPRNVFSSSPGSRALSPARGDGSGSPSLPSQFSLPDKLSKGMEFPEFGSTATAPVRGTSVDPPKISVFGFSTRPPDDSKTGNHPSYRPSPLSQQSSLGSQEMDDSKKKKKDSEVVEPQFHFSIYKWANPIPLVMPLYRTNSKNLKERQGKQTSTDVHPAAVLHDHVLGSETKPLQSFLRDEPGKADSGKKNEQQRTKKVSKNKDEVSFKKQDSESTLPKKEDVQKVPLQESVKPAGPESTPKRRGKSKVKDFIRIFNQETPSKSRTPNSPPIRGSGREEEPTPTVEAVAQQEKSKKVAADDEKIKIPKADGSKPRSTNSPSSRSSGWKETAAPVEAATLKEKSQKSAVDDEKINISKTMEAPEKKQDASDKKIGSTPRRSQKEESKSTAGISKPPPSSHSSSSPTKNTGEGRPTKKNTETIPENARAAAEEADDSSQTNFTIRELSEEEQKQGEATGESEEIQATDAKIRQWARGKEGNIRSLLTTLQFVLWPGSGWKPVALMSIIEGPGVKRAYQKAMLCLHPDKLQQKGASSHQKYVAEKVFDILQEAWDHFNTLGGL